MLRFAKIRSAVAITALFTALVLLVSPVALYAFEIIIEVAPRVLNIQSKGTVVTVHTDIAYPAVDTHSVSLNGVEISSWKADAQGNFVAKFSMQAIKNLPGLVIGENNTLRLAGVTSLGEPFEGETEVLVIDVIPKGR